MACTKADLEKTFLDCVSAFNAYDRGISGFLDQNVEITTVRKHNQRTYCPKPAVEDYFFKDQYVRDNPHFDPCQHNKDYHVSVNGTQGTVRGVGTWIDDEERKNGRPAFVLPYVFKFECTNGSWLLSYGKSL